MDDLTEPEDAVNAWQDAALAADLAERLAVAAPDATRETARDPGDAEAIAGLAEHAAATADHAASRASSAAVRARALADAMRASASESTAPSAATGPEGDPQR